MLNMTRSLGNYAFKADPENPVVSGEPDISVVDLAGFSNAYLLIASDGMWNHITDDDDHNVQREAVLEVLRSYVDQSTGALDCSAACEELKRRCRMLAHGSATSRGFYFDDLSCILNELRL
jgi:serine/threonine protein phosphatase PrpC